MTLQQEPQSWTIRDLMKFSIDHLQRHGFDEARLTVELLLSHALQCQRIDLYTRFDQPLKKEELKRFRSLYERRLRHEPVQYIVGSAGFMGMQFQVDRRVLIPRPETETLIEQVLMLCRQWSGENSISMVDVGTGSGNVAIAAAKLVRNLNVTSIDVDGDAIEVAKLNAAAHGVMERLAFHQMSVFDSAATLFEQKFHFLVSNPPYVPALEWESLAPEIREFEPRAAVSDNGDGLAFYRRIAEISGSILRNCGSVLVEVGHDQAERVKEIFGEAGVVDLSAVKDLEGIARVVIGRTK